MSKQTRQPKSDLKDTHRLSFLLRLWRAEGTQDFDWRASLENPETGERIGFSNLEQLFVYLIDLVESLAANQQQTDVPF